MFTKLGSAEALSTFGFLMSSIKEKKKEKKEKEELLFRIPRLTINRVVNSRPNCLDKSTHGTLLIYMLSTQYPFLDYFHSMIKQYYL